MKTASDASEYNADPPVRAGFVESWGHPNLSTLKRNDAIRWSLVAVKRMINGLEEKQNDALWVELQGERENDFFIDGPNTHGRASSVPIHRLRPLYG